MSGFKPPSSLPTVFDASFAGVGTQVGLEIWRVEKLAVVKKPPTDDAYKGKLYTGDSYIILQTKLRENALEHHIFFWLGAETSQDEMGVAAYKTVELDQSMGGEPVQHREVQGHETDQFLALFKAVGGLTYLAGGIATGFKHVDRDAFATRLLHVKGRRNIRVQQVEPKAESINTGDVFILDAGREIIQWNGNESSTVERQKALEITRKIRDEERSGKAAITIIDERKDDDRKFWAALGVAKPPKLKTAADGGSDDAHTQRGSESVKLYQLSDAKGSLEITEVAARPLKKELLSTNEAYVLDVKSAIFAWIGKGASQTEKLHAMKYATDFIAKNGYPTWTPVTRLVEGGETPLFKQYFDNWPELNASAAGGTAPAGQRKKFVGKTFDAASMHTKGTREQTRLPDDGSGSLKLWRIEKFEKAEVPTEQFGQFYSGDSYLMLYTYLVNGVEKYIIYFWQGLKSSQDEKGASALWATKLDDELKGAAVQIRVVQNKEPEHFYLMFKSKMVVHEGGAASGFKNVGATDSYDTDGTRLFQIKGTNPSNTRAIQVPEKAASLNSGDVFFLETPKGNFLWCGANCSGDERETGKAIAKVVSAKEYATVAEGAEPADFWTALGGKGEYAKTKVVPQDKRHEPRLFQCSNNKGYFYVEEVFDFDQEDLIEDDVQILDNYDEVFVWIGNGANAEEKKKALETAIKYVETDKSGRKVEDTVFITLKQGFEPPNFTAQFPAWDAGKWSGGKTYAELKAELVKSNPEGLPAAVASPVSVQTALKAFTPDRFYSIDEVKGNKLPEGADLSKKELYLSDADFVTLFKMTKAEFGKLPEWKAKNAKKSAGVF